MRGSDYVRLFFLAAIWGGSFIFMRVLAPALGPVMTACLRVSVAGLLLLAWFRATGVDPGWRQHWRHYLIVGLVNSGVPFTLYSFAALHIPAAYSAIFNSSAPLFGAVFAALWLDEPLTTRKLAGLALGMGGVGLTAWRGHAATSPMFLWAALACLTAATCYGLAGVYLKQHARGLAPGAMAACSQVCAGACLLPLAATQSVPGPVTMAVGANMLGLAVLCSGVAYLIYYRLMADIGPTRTLTVTFLIPAFGMLWGAVFLGERITSAMLAGCALIVAGTVLVTGWSPRSQQKVPGR
jgi:drug/metabolite transporter (DMT)-like permease